ncbi:MAG TPA: nuclear transport factor 2 family protein [Streptosporangiaceae bacterium]|nr:nuclear transport factor 2 family protein [Streptosporangiaceae bacterium]
MADQKSTTPTLSRQRMDALVDGHFRAEETGDLHAIVEGFTAGAEHEVAGIPGGPIHGHDEIVAFYAGLLAELPITRLERVRRWYGQDHVVDESILHATAKGQVFGIKGRNTPVRVGLLHVFEFADGMICRESAWLDVASLQRQLA